MKTMSTLTLRLASIWLFNTGVNAKSAAPTPSADGSSINEIGTGGKGRGVVLGVGYVGMGPVGEG
jgi:hypothetical protein